MKNRRKAVFPIYSDCLMIRLFEFQSLLCVCVVSEGDVMKKVRRYSEATLVSLLVTACGGGDNSSNMTLIIRQ